MNDQRTNKFNKARNVRYFFKPKSLVTFLRSHPHLNPNLSSSDSKSSAEDLRFIVALIDEMPSIHQVDSDRT